MAKRRILIGRELRVAAEKGLKVYFEMKNSNPHDKHYDYKGECVMEKAQIGYYIGNTDIVPEDYELDQLVKSDETEEVSKVVKSVPGVKYE